MEVVNWGAAAAAAWRVMELLHHEVLFSDSISPPIASDDRNSAIVIHEPNCDFRPRNNYYDILIVAVIQTLHYAVNFLLMHHMLGTSYEQN